MLATYQVLLPVRKAHTMGVGLGAHRVVVKAHSAGEARVRAHAQVRREGEYEIIPSMTRTYAGVAMRIGG